MKLVLALLFPIFCIADTPPPGLVKSKTLDGSGTAITSSTVGLKQALDVSLASGSIGISGTIPVALTNQLGTLNIANFPLVSAILGTVTIANPQTTVAITNYPNSQKINGTVGIDNFPASQNINGTVNIANLPLINYVAGTTNIGNLPATQNVAGTVVVSNTARSISNFPSVQTVSGTVSVLNSNGTVSISNLPAVQVVSGTTNVGNFPSTQNISGTIACSNCSGGGSTSGTVAVSNFPASQAVAITGTIPVSVTNQLGTVAISNLPSTQNINGTITVANPITSVTVSNFPVVQATSGTQAISNFPASQATTVTNGTITISNPISGFATSAKQDNLLASSGSINSDTTAINSKLAGTLSVSLASKYVTRIFPAVGTGTLSISLGKGISEITVDLYDPDNCSGFGCAATDQTFNFYASIDGINFRAISCSDGTILDDQVPIDTSGSQGFFRCPVSGFETFEMVGGGGLKRAALNIAASAANSMIQQVQAQVFCSNCSGGAGGGGLTDTQLRASPVPVSISNSLTANVNGTVSVAGVIPINGTTNISGPVNIFGTTAVSFGTLGLYGSNTTFGGNTSASLGTLVAATDVSQYATTIVKVTLGAVGNQIQVQYSNDITFSYLAGICYNPANSGTSTGSVTTIITGGNYICPVQGKYMKIVNTAYSSGTDIVGGFSSATPFSPVHMNTYTTLSGGVQVNNGTLNVVTAVTGITNPVAVFGTIQAAGIQQVSGSISLATTGTMVIATGGNVIGSISNTAFTANAGTNLNTSALALETGGNLAAAKTDLDAINTSDSSSASHLNTIDAKLPSSLGQKTMATSLAVVLPSDQTVPVLGSLFVTQVPLSPISVSFNESAAAPTAATWYKKRQWQVPSGSTFLPDKAKSTVTTAGSRTFIGTGVVMGSLNLSSNAFTDASAVTAPRFFSRMFGCVTTVMSATSDNITVTYTDDLGNSHSTAATTFPASTPVGDCIEFPLATTTGQMTDTGFRDVTNITDSAAPTGIIEIIGMNTLHDALGAANAFELSTLDNSVVLQNEFVWILEMQAATTAQQRGGSLEGAIRTP